jgi:predicted nucleic acid-binding protein
LFPFIDDARAKKVAYLNNRGVGVLLLDKRNGLIPKIKPLLTRLRCFDIFISEYNLEQMLVTSGESEG